MCVLQDMTWDGSTTLDEAQDPVLEENEDVRLRQYYFPLCFCACASATSVLPAVLRPIVLIPGRPLQDSDEMHEEEQDPRVLLQSISLDHVRVCVSVCVCVCVSVSLSVFSRRFLRPWCCA